MQCEIESTQSQIKINIIKVGEIKSRPRSRLRKTKSRLKLGKLRKMRSWFKHRKIRPESEVHIVFVFCYPNLFHLG